MSIVGTSSQTPRFSPDTLPGLALWLDAADRDSVALSGSNVTRWLDKSGLGNHASGGVSPTFSNAGIVFNGTTTYLSTPYTSFPAVETVVIVATATPPSNAHNCMLGAGVTGGRSYSVLRYPGGVEVRWDKYAVNSYSPTVVAVNTRFLTTGVFTGSGGTTSVNGGAQAGTDSFSFSGTGGTNIGATFENGYFNGTINEILVYNAVLSTTERQQVEGYLARKWGISALTGHPFRFGGSGILPTQIAGCSLWLDAADATTFTLSGSNVTQWRDKSGSGNHATTATGTLTRSSNSVVFTGTQAMTTTLSSVMTTQSIFIVASANSNAFMDLLGVNSTTMSTGIQYLIGTNYTQRVTRYGGTMIFDVGGTVSQNANFLYGATYTSGGDSVLYLNGSQTRTTSSSPTISGSGATVLIGAYSEGTYGELYVGTISEILIYSTVLTTAQRQQIEGYLAWKWGLSTALPAPTTTIPYAGAILPMRAFSPLDIDGLSVWFDAADQESLTISGSNVTQWRDKSGNARHLNSGGSPPTYAASSRSIAYNGSQWLSSADHQIINPTTGTWSVFLVASVTSTSAVTQLFFDADGPPYRVGQFLRALVPGGQVSSIGSDSNGNLYDANAPGTISLNTPFLGGAVNGTSFLTAYLNGVGGTPTSHSTNSTYPANVFSAGVNTEGSGRYSYLFGTLSEIVFYAKALSTSERQQVESYLADKWGLRGSMGGVSHPYRFGPAVVLPNQIPGCSFWLDAADATTLTLSGSNVTAWRDKTGLTTLSLCNTAPTYVSNQVQFNASARFMGSYTMTTQTTVFAVYSTTSTTTNEWLLSFNGNEYGNINAPVPIYAGGYADLAVGTGGGWPANEFWTTLTPQTGRRMYVVGFNGSNTAVWRNGSPATMSGTPANVTANGTIISVGAAYTGWAPWAGALSELILFSNTLTTTQRQQVEGYLAWKWGLQANLPSPTTSWLQVKRALTPVFTPTQIPGCAFWIDAADTASMTLSGSNVTQWRDKSGNGHIGTAVASPVLTTVDGVPAVTFNGSSQYIDFGTAGSLGSNQFHIFTVSKFNTTADGSILARVANGDQYYRYTMLRVNGVMYLATQADTGSYGSNASFADTNTSRRLLSYSWDRSTITGFQNGTVVGSGSYARTATYTSSFKLLVAAYNNSSGGTPPSDGFYMNGSINEILFYFGPLTTAQRQRIEGYLAEKWGLRGSLGGPNHPSRFGPPMILPTQISGCTLWLDAADATTLTLSGSNVTAWRNKSGSASLTLFGTAPTYVSNQVVFNASGRFRGAYALTTQTTMFAVYSTSNTTTNARLISVDGNYYGNVHAPTPYEGTDLFVYDGGAGGYWSTLPPQTGLRMYTIGFNGVNSMIWRNGSAATLTGTRAAGPATGSNISVGGNLDGGDPFNGAISELILFSAALTDLQRQQVEGYLAWKWGLQTNLPTSTHPYKTIKP